MELEVVGGVGIGGQSGVISSHPPAGNVSR
jgi:hypothetical protein